VTRALVGLACFLVLACDNGPPACPDGSSCTDATVDVAEVLGTFSASATQVVIDPGESRPVVVTLDRGTVTGPIDITVEGMPQGITATPLTILPGSSAGTFDFQAATTVSIPQDVDVTLRATAGTSTLTTPMHLRIGSVFHVATQSESFQVPQGLTSVVLHVWGGGGGAGGGSGGLGGGGGYATAEIPVTGGDTLDIVVGGGGAPGAYVSGASWSGGIGGSYSAVYRGTTLLVMAGGGGGGGGAGFDFVADAGGAAGLAGGAGGGAIGQTGFGPCGGGGGTDAGGGAAGSALAQDGVALDGGAGAPADDAGGAGGGGAGGSGLFGGGGGGGQDAAAGYGCGGGGGSAFVATEGASPKLLTGSGQVPGGITAYVYDADSGAAFGGALSDAGAPLSGAAGLVLVAYPK
jgi:hypothetical protein